MILVALTVLLATCFGILFERRSSRAPTISGGVLWSMLYLLVPFVSFVNVAHLRLTVGAGTGLLVAYAAIALAGVAGWLAGRWLLHLPRREIGALICSVILVNTGYLGLPLAVTLLGSGTLGTAVLYDQLVSGPTLFIAGFGIGAAFGRVNGAGRSARWRAFLARNPPLLAVIAGLLAPPSAAPVPLPAISHVVVAAVLPLGFFAVGVNLSAERREDHAALLEWPDRRALVAIGLRLIMVPGFVGLFSLAAVRLPAAYLLQAAMPTGINSLVVGHAFGLDQRLIATVIVWSTAAVLVVGLVAGLTS